MFELMYMTDNALPSSPSQLSFVEEFQAGTLDLIASLPPGTGVFSPTCLVHCLSGQTKNGQTPFSQLQSAGTTLAAALTAWYVNGDDVLAVSDCVGWNCTYACGIDMRTGLPCNMDTALGAAQTCSPITVMVPDVGATTSTDTSGEVDTADVRATMSRLQVQEAANARAFLEAQEAAIVHASEAALSSEQQTALAQLLATGVTAGAPRAAAAVARRALRASGGCCGQHNADEVAAR